MICIDSKTVELNECHIIRKVHGEFINRTEKCFEVGRWICSAILIAISKTINIFKLCKLLLHKCFIVSKDKII